MREWDNSRIQHLPTLLLRCKMNLSSMMGNYIWTKGTTMDGMEVRHAGVWLLIIFWRFYF